MECFKIVLMAFAILGLSQITEAKKIPDFVPLCKEHSANISECWKNTFNLLVPRLADGLPAMKLRKIEPLDVEKVYMKLGHDALTLDAQVSNVKIHGLSGLRATHVDLDTDKVVIKIDGDVPYINIEGKFKALGAVLQNEINGEGTFIGNCTNLSGKSTWSGRKFKKNGVIYVTMEDGDIDIKIDGIKMKFNNLVDSASLNERLNTIINDNVDILYEIVKPIITKTTKSVLFDAMNNVFHNFPFNVLYPK